MPENEEREILAGCRQGEPAALRRLVDAHYEPLYRFLWRLTGSPDSAAELTQETFVRALVRLDSFDGRSRFSTWLHAIAVNFWKDSRRRRAREAHAAADQASGAEASSDCQQQALSHLEKDEVRRAVERLPEAQRIATLLFYYEGLSYKEIAQICDVSVGTVGSWIHHGIRGLRRILAERDPSSDEAPHHGSTDQPQSARERPSRCFSVRKAKETP